MTTFMITAGAISSTYDAADEQGAILAYVQDAGYSSVKDAAAVCGQTVEQFLADIMVERVNDPGASRQ